MRLRYDSAPDTEIRLYLILLYFNEIVIEVIG
jgi:hypothetical protein